MMSMRLRRVGVGAAGVVEDDRRLAATRARGRPRASRRRGRRRGSCGEPRIGPVVTLSSVRAGTSRHLDSPLPTPVSAGSGSTGRGLAARLSAPRQQLPREESSLGSPGAVRHARGGYFWPAAARASAGLTMPSWLVSTLVELGELRRAELVGADLAVLVGVELLRASGRRFWFDLTAARPPGIPRG